ncbi:hypothetical protein GGR51DRAFT_555478 [Nemania sp. FL0031]|nr:hypothetical protein GGR51DRAFT_555478 [Nemania sp. FL0031]
MASSGTKSGAKFFGQNSPHDLKKLEANAAKATSKQLAKAASYIEKAFTGQSYAWFGGWALKLRGSRRETKDLDLIVVARDVGQVRATLTPYSWVALCYYEGTGSIHERLFVDIDEGGQVVGVDIVLSGKLDTPDLQNPESFEIIKPMIRTPQGNQVTVIDLTWQVEGKLKAWITRRKHSDFLDLQFLFESYGMAIQEWSQHLRMDWRVDFYEIYKLEMPDKSSHKRMHKILGLDQASGSHGSSASQAAGLGSTSSGQPSQGNSTSMRSPQPTQKEEVWVEVTRTGDTLSFEFGQTQDKKGKQKAKRFKNKASSWKPSTTMYQGRSAVCYKFDSKDHGVVFCTWNI